MSDVEAAEAIRAVMLVGFGALEGYAFATCGMGYPEAFRSQMGFSRNILLQMFMSAVGSSMLAQSVLNLISPDKFDNSRVWKYTSVGFKRVIVGCGMLGAGMAIGGSGPTMLPTQIALGTQNSLVTLFGGIVGGAIFSYLEQNGYFTTNTDPKHGEKLTVEHHFGGHYSVWAAVFGSALIGGALAVPMILDTSKDRSSLSPLLTTAPIVAGLSVGLNQIPVRLISECGQGGSRSLMQIVHLFTGGKLAKRFSLKRISAGNQLWYVWGGTLIGAVIASAHLSLPSPHGYSAVEAFVGGLLMMFGSRVAAGCACGHGVSGFSELSLQSMAGAAAMFGCGILTKLVFNLKN